MTIQSFLTLWINIQLWPNPISTRIKMDCTSYHQVDSPATRNLLAVWRNLGEKIHTTRFWTTSKQKLVPGRPVLKISAEKSSCHQILLWATSALWFNFLVVIWFKLIHLQKLLLWNFYLDWLYVRWCAKHGQQNRKRRRVFTKLTKISLLFC